MIKTRQHTYSRALNYKLIFLQFYTFFFILIINPVRYSSHTAPLIHKFPPLSSLSHSIPPQHLFPHRFLRQLHVTVQFHRILYMGRPLRKHQPENGIRSFFPFPLRFRHGQPVNILGQMSEGCRNGITDVPGAFPLPAVLVPIHPALEPGQIHPPFSENRL